MLFDRIAKRGEILKRSIASSPIRGGGGGPALPAGFVFLVDDDGAYLIDDDGAYLIEEA